MNSSKIHCLSFVSIVPFHQRLDSLPVTKKKGNPKSLTQVCFNSISPSFSNSIALFRRRRRAGLFSTLSFFFCNSNFSSQMKKKSLQKPSKKMDKMYKKMLEKQRLQKKREKYEKLHKKTKKQVPWRGDSHQGGFNLRLFTIFESVTQVLPTPVFRVPTDMIYK